MENTITNTVQYTVVELRPHVYVPEEPAEFHAQEAVGCH